MQKEVEKFSAQHELNILRIVFGIEDNMKTDALSKMGGRVWVRLIFQFLGRRTKSAYTAVLIVDAVKRVNMVLRGIHVGDKTALGWVKQN